VLSGDDDVSKIDAPSANLQAPNGDDAEGEGASLVELIAPRPIGSNAPVQMILPLSIGLLLVLHLLVGTNGSVFQSSPNKNFGK
jgi:hypothetical protein